VRSHALAIALLLVGLVPASGQGQERSDRARSEQERIRDRLEMLQDSLKVVVGRMETARKSVEAYSSELDELEKEIEALGEVPEALPLQARVLSLRRTLMESGMGRPTIRISTEEQLRDPEYWRRFLPDPEAFEGTSTRSQIFRIGEDVEVGVFEKVRGDVVSIGGRVTVHGSVSGNVVSVGHDIHVTSTGRIGGDAVTIGGRIIQDPGGTIRGQFVDLHDIWPLHWSMGLPRLAWFALGLAWMVFVLAVCVLVGLVVPANVGRVEVHVRRHFGISFLVGLACLVALPVLFILLLITIVGIPVAVILLPIALIGLFLLGFCGVSQAVGRGAGHRGLPLGSSDIAKIAVGVILLEAIDLLGHALGPGGILVGPLAMMLRVLGWLILFTAWTTGLGAAVLTRFGTRTPGEPVVPKPAPAPVGGDPIF
jgi:hypothetical protein